MTLAEAPGNTAGDLEGFGKPQGPRLTLIGYQISDSSKNLLAMSPNPLSPPKPLEASALNVQGSQLVS